MPAIDYPTLPEPGQLRLDIPPDGLGTLDFLTLSGCSVQATIGKRNSSLGRMARDSQRLLLALEYLQLAPQCTTHLRDNNKGAVAELLEQSWRLQQQQLPALIFNATVGGSEYRAFWLTSPASGEYPSVPNNRVISALEAISHHAHRWLGGDYQAHNRDFEILLSEVAGGKGGALLQGLNGRYHELLLPITALEDLLNSALPAGYRAWRSERSARILNLALTLYTGTNCSGNINVPKAGEIGYTGDTTTHTCRPTCPEISMIHLPRIALRKFVLPVFILSLAACASGPPKPTVDHKPGYNFMQVKKIAFYKDSGEVSGDNPLQLSDMQRNRIDNALESALSVKGFQIVDDASQADLLISWHLVTQHKTDVRTWETPTYGGYSGYGGYGRYNRYSAYNCWNCSPTRTEVSVQNYTQGTFIVDMIDPALHQSVWRGVTQSRLRGKQEEDQGKYNEAATAIFASFPP